MYHVSLTFFMKFVVSSMDLLSNVSRLKGYYDLDVGLFRTNG